MVRKLLHKKRIMLCALFAICITTSFACSKKEEKTEKPQEKEDVVVGFSMGTLMEDRWISDRNMFIDMAGQQGIDVIINNANNDSDLQYKQVTEMIRQGIDVLVIVPNDCNSESRCVKAAKDKNIPVISYDRLVYNSNVDAYISFDHEKVGEIIAGYLLEKAPEGGYYIVNGSDTDSNCKLIYEGAMKILKPYIEKDQIQLLGEIWVDGWKRETAYDYVSEQLKDNKDKVKAIVCGNDSMAWGVIDALSEAQIAENVVVGGQDADLVACQRIVTGKQLVTVYKPIKNLVSRTVEACLKLADGEEIKGQETINDGTYDVPYVMIDVVAVTKDNIDDTVIKDGFHLREDVYQTDEE